MLNKIFNSFILQRFYKKGSLLSFTLHYPINRQSEIFFNLQ